MRIISAIELDRFLSEILTDERTLRFVQLNKLRSYKDPIGAEIASWNYMQSRYFGKGWL